MNKTPTANSFLKQKYPISYDEMPSHVSEDMIEFAKLHLEAQQKAILEKAFVTHKETEKGDEYIINKDSVLDAYPLNNIL